MTLREWSEILAGLPEAELSAALFALSDEDWLDDGHRGWLRGKAADPDGFYPCPTDEPQPNDGAPRVRSKKPTYAKAVGWYWIEDTWCRDEPEPNKYRRAPWHEANTCVVPAALYARMTGPLLYGKTASACWLRRYTSATSAWLDLLEVLQRDHATVG